MNTFFDYAVMCYVIHIYTLLYNPINVSLLVHWLALWFCNSQIEG